MIQRRQIQPPPDRPDTASDIRSDQTRLLSFFLPQFHPIPENDEWWGTGFTEWRNVVTAKPLFRGHYQPHLPADLGFYDLRVPEVRAAQAELAATHGIHGFVWHHYWFGGRRLLERPFDEVLASGEPNFPFCLCWANEPWSRRWDGRDHDLLMAQNYSPEDDLAHARWLARAFADPRYVHLDGRPLLLVYRASLLPDPKRTATILREECTRLGVGEPYICRVESYFPEEYADPQSIGFDAAVEFPPHWSATAVGRPLHRLRPWWWTRRLRLTSRAFGQHFIYDYATVAEASASRPEPEYRRFPGVTPAWDNTARRDSSGTVLVGSTPALYERWLRSAITRDEPVVFINAWNEWAEGCHLEPDLRWGHAYLEATARAIRVAA
jgi:lipopolysaccharide biosynthesis protein